MQHLWLKSYPPHVHWHADISQTPVQQVLEDAVALWPDRCAIRFMGSTTTYREVDELANRAAKGFQRVGVKPGVQVGLYLPNTPHYIICFFGIMKAGGTVVNYSPLDAQTSVSLKLADSDTEIVVTSGHAPLYPLMRELLGTARLRKLVVCDLSTMSSKSAAETAQNYSLVNSIEVQEDDRHITLETILDNDGVYHDYPIADPAERIAVIQYTGGTTGHPKGAMLTHANLTAATSQSVETTGGEPRVLGLSKEVFLGVLPLFHIYSLTMNMLLGLRIGAELVIHSRFDVDAVIDDIASKKITAFPGVPTMFIAILNHPRAAIANFRSLRWCNSGGAPLPVEVLSQFEKLAGCRLTEGWGMTETSPTGTFTPATGKRKPGSCGIPGPRIIIKFLDLRDPKRYVAPGELGELCIAGPNVMKGYWRNPVATSEAMTIDGFMRTGDVGYMDSDGYIYLVDRIKDMLLCGGFNVYPRIIEDAIYRHPSVEEVSVIAIQDDYRGETPKAFIKLKDGAPPFSFEELKAFLVDKLGKHEMPSSMEIRLELPKTVVGKLSKKLLQEEVRSETQTQATFI